MSFTELGIDISHWNEILDYDAVAKRISFAIVKAGGSDRGFYTDKKFQQHFSELSARNIKMGSYYYVGHNFQSEKDGKEDAKRFADIIAGLKFQMPVYLDLESTPMTPEGRKRATSASIAFLDYMEKELGYYAGIYGSEISTFAERVNDSELTAYAHWVAKYSSKHPSIPHGIWQYTSNGNMPGVAGKVDIDIAYVDYFSAIKKAGLNGYGKEKK